MRWHFINTGFNSGRYNMELDIDLANNCKPDEGIFRLYKWQPHCISLGANQNDDILNLEKLKKDSIEFVKRPTGGRAILHADEVTYSVIYPLSQGDSARNIYTEINFALKAGLEKYDDRLNKAELENIQPDFSVLYKNISGDICFASSAKSELKYNSKKLIGSAQRKLKNCILQHGSILCSSKHKKIINYLNLSAEEKILIKKELDSSTTDLEEILKYKINPDDLSDSLISGFCEYFNIYDERTIHNSVV